MSSLKFYIKDAKAEKSNIFFRLNYGAFDMVNGKKKYQPLKYYVNESVNPKFWNSKTGRVKQNNSFRQYPEFNARLQDIEDRALSLLRKMQNDGKIINNDILRNELDLIFKPHKIQSMTKALQFIDFLNYYLDTSGIKSNTKKAYKQTNRDLLEYEEAKGIKLTFDRIDIDFHDNFIIFLKNKDYSTNTIGDRIKVIKTIMRASHERGLHNNTDYQKKAFHKPKEETKAIYLNDKELTHIYNLDLSDNNKLDNVRDWFIIAAYTGLRFSDLLDLGRDDIKTDTIEVKTGKTGAIVVIPLHTYVKAILEKHKYNLPKLISNQKFNEYIKEIAIKAKINDSIVVEQTKGRLKTKTTEQKHDLISAHTARRSFATNAFIAGVPPIQIMKLTGHKTEKVFMNYIKITEAENAKKLQLHPFFNKMIVNK